MIDKQTVFVLGAGASCPYGYPSGSRLRELICFDGGFTNSYLNYLRISNFDQITKDKKRKEVSQFIKIFKDANIKSIDVFMANNPKLAPIGKYIIAYEIFRAEQNSCFGEEAKRRKEQLEDDQQSPSKKRYIWGTADFIGGDWYSYLYNRLIEGLVGKEALPDFSDGKIVFITFNYDRSLEQFLYESLYNSFVEVLDDRIVQYFKKSKISPVTEQIAPQNRELLMELLLKQLKILHVYGQIAPLKWQNPNDYVDYKPQPSESLLQHTANNIRTIYEEKQNPELTEAQNLLKQAERIFFLGFGYAPENMEVLRLPESIPPNCKVYGTAFGLIEEEIKRIYTNVHGGRKYEKATKIESGNVDCLMLLRKYLN